MTSDTLKIHTHIQTTTALHAKTAQEAEGYKRSELKECGADGPAASIYDKLGQSNAYLVNSQLGTYWNGDRGGGDFCVCACLCV